MRSPFLNKTQDDFSSSELLLPVPYYNPQEIEHPTTVLQPWNANSPAIRRALDMSRRALELSTCQAEAVQTYCAAPPPPPPPPSTPIVVCGAGTSFVAATGQCEVMCEEDPVSAGSRRLSAAELLESAEVDETEGSSEYGDASHEIVASFLSKHPELAASMDGTSHKKMGNYMELLLAELFGRPALA
jgi:hypothetical protein